MAFWIANCMLTRNGILEQLHCTKKGVHDNTCGVHDKYGVQYTLTCPYMHTSSVSYTLQFLQLVYSYLILMYKWYRCNYASLYVQWCQIHAVASLHETSLYRESAGASGCLIKIGRMHEQGQARCA